MHTQGALELCSRDLKFWNAEGKKSFNIPPQSFLWIPNFQSTYPTGEYDWVHSFYILQSAKSLSVWAQQFPSQELWSQKEKRRGRGEVSISKAQKETVAAVSNTIKLCISIFYLMSNTLGLVQMSIHKRDFLLVWAFQANCQNAACLKEIRGRGANIEYSRTNETLFRKTGLFHS